MLLEAVVYTLFAFAILGLLLLALGYYLRHAQDLLLYHPDSPANSTVSCDAPHAWGIRNSDRVEIVTADGVTLAGYMMRTNNNKASASSSSASSSPPPFVIYFHGNAGNVGHRLPIAKAMLDGCGCDVLMMDYRGYGLSDAVRPCEVGLQLDATAVMDWAVKRAAPGAKIVVMGVSLGGAVGLYIASHRKYRSLISGLILENTFVGISEMADAIFEMGAAKRFPHIGGKILSFVLRRLIKPLLIQIHWRSIDRVSQVGVPILFLSGLRDEVVPPAQMRTLFEAATRAPRKRFVAFETGMHNDLCSKDGGEGDGFFEHLKKFLVECL